MDVNSPTPMVRTERSDSQASLTSTMLDACRICHCEAEPGAPLISPCVCSGSLKYVHQACLQQWIKSADTKSCELCKFNFEMTTKIKPFRKVSAEYSDAPCNKIGTSACMTLSPQCCYHCCICIRFSVMLAVSFVQASSSYLILTYYKFMVISPS